jgi:hypothetical protein
MEIIMSRCASNVPGDTLREMTADHVDASGRVWPVGTVYQPVSAGRDSTRGLDTQIVSIAGSRVTFAARAMPARVVTYRLAYLDREVSLCASCVEHDDHDCGSIGPVRHGLHRGDCAGAMHRAARA